MAFVRRLALIGNLRYIPPKVPPPSNKLEKVKKLEKLGRLENFSNNDTHLRTKKHEMPLQIGFIRSPPPWVHV